MANEHLKTAAANLQRAVSDVKQLQQELRTNMDNAKRNAMQQESAYRTQMIQLQRKRDDSNTDTANKIAMDVEHRNLQLRIDDIKKTTDKYVSDVEHQLSGLDGQVSEFQSLASRLEMLA